MSLKNVDTGLRVTVTTDSKGYYLIASVAPGNYEITASLPGFSTQVQSGYVFEVGSHTDGQFGTILKSYRRTAP